MFLGSHLPKNGFVDNKKVLKRKIVFFLRFENYICNAFVFAIRIILTLKIRIGSMEEFENNDSQEKDEIFSKAVRAGKRTYFFDVKSTKKNDFYLTITERKRRYEQDGSFVIEKHKIFLYKEDFEKFSEGLAEVVEFIRSNNGHSFEPQPEAEEKFSEIEFEDLDE